MGSQEIDIVLFALVAGFFVFQLWRVLGKRTGDERPPQAPPAPLKPSNNVVPLPPRLAAEVIPPPPVPQDLHPATVQSGLAEISRADRGFRADAFLGGARHAFEIIVKAFAAGDTATLRPLSSDEVYEIFAEAIRHRLATKESLDTRILHLEEPEIVEARLDGPTATVTVRFTSNQISVTRAADGNLLEGDPDHPHERIDLWTFARDTRSPNPNWALVATGTPA